MNDKYQIVIGNIFDTDADVIVHQVNCQGVMGGGLARQVKVRYPDCYDIYNALCKKAKQKNIKILGSVYYYTAPDFHIIANVFGQESYGCGKQHTDYNALRDGLHSVHDTAMLDQLTVAIPYGLGCERGGGDWETVYRIICDIFDPDFDPEKLRIYKLK